MTELSSPVISKKIEGARKIVAPLPRLSEIIAEMTKVIEKNARAYLGCVVETMILEVETKSFASVLDAVSMPAMLGVVEVDGVDRAALMNFDLDLVYHIVDLRLGGSPTENPEFGARRPTAIDNQICLPMVEIALTGFEAGLEEAYGVEDLLDFACDGFEHMPMMANIVPDLADVLVIQVSMDIGEAARSGNFELVLPFATIDRIKAKLKKTASVSSGNTNDAWASHMLNVVLETEVELTPVLQSLTATVGDLSSLKVGQILPLNDDAHREVDVRMDVTDDEETVVSARLGSYKTQKALKLTAEPDGEFFEPLRRMAADRPRS